MGMNKWEKYLIEGGKMPELELDEVPEPDVDATEENLYDLYILDCSNRGLKTSIKDYIIWLGENYD